MNSSPIHPKLAEITERIIERSRPTREKYLAKIRSAKQMGRLERNQLGCSNLAHGYAAMPKSIKIEMLQETVPNLGIITAYNDMVSAYQPFKDFPNQIKDEAPKNGAAAQVAGGTPAMCDDITQGYAGMELSLFFRYVIAMSTAIGLSHQMFDSGLFTGELNVLINEAEWNAREVERIDLSANQQGCGRELFANFRSMTSSAETGAMSFGGKFA